MPGHGPVTDAAGVRQVRKYFSYLQQAQKQVTNKWCLTKKWSKDPERKKSHKDKMKETNISQKVNEKTLHGA